MGGIKSICWTFDFASAHDLWFMKWWRIQWQKCADVIRMLLGSAGEMIIISIRD